MHSAGAALFFSLEGTTTTIHNYIDTEAMILRKGAVSAKAGERLLIPMNTGYDLPPVIPFIGISYPLQAVLYYVCYCG